MKNISITLNAILLLAVAYLYFLHFSSNKAITTPKTETPATTAITPIVAKEIKGSKIVYINADSLFSNYNYAKEIQKTAMARKAALEKNYNSKLETFQQDYMAYQQKASQGNISLEVAKATEEDLMRRKSELDGMEDDLSQLIDDTQKKNSEIQKEITAFLSEYNQTSNYNFVLAYTESAGGILYASDSLDITTEVVEGLNKRYAEKKKNNASTKK